MADKNGIWAFILRIIIQILNFVLFKILRCRKNGTKGDDIEYRQDEQENKEMKEKVEEKIKEKLNKKGRK